MIRVTQYHLAPTALVPNSPLPLLHYRGVFDQPTPGEVLDVLSSNGWKAKWLVRYGPTQPSHYHSAVHEAMVVLSGTAKIMFGVADVNPGDKNSEQEAGGILVEAHVGDVFVLPSGLAHKTHDPSPSLAFKRLTPGDGHDADDNEMDFAIRNAELSGFTMLGSYPADGGDWDFAVGGESEGKYEQVWSVKLPEKDPVLGYSENGIHRYWSKHKKTNSQ
ncbi:hypothetical protein QQS21_001974 [Conoideocrella luteorostrata]|uniref:Cupin type-1 domain-containing protein n=1 Tax=Conoideocrella luteorostrata TaxID=1105319 RepID=A0AAJ0CW08_9HYPO|nr:hypothetical protein QQS21_001974 [Conoideocrella luteorostrata]